MLQLEQIVALYLRSDDQIGDILTKLLSPNTFQCPYVPSRACLMCVLQLEQGC